MPKTRRDPISTIKITLTPGTLARAQKHASNKRLSFSKWVAKLLHRALKDSPRSGR